MHNFDPKNTRLWPHWHNLSPTLAFWHHMLPIPAPPLLWTWHREGPTRADETSSHLKRTMGGPLKVDMGLKVCFCKNTQKLGHLMHFTVFFYFLGRGTLFLTCKTYIAIQCQEELIFNESDTSQPQKVLAKATCLWHVARPISQIRGRSNQWRL
jgi:hypothetical protein